MKIGINIHLTSNFSSKKRRVIQGGSCIDNPWSLRAANRKWFGPYDWLRINGFRLVVERRLP